MKFYATKSESFAFPWQVGVILVLLAGLLGASAFTAVNDIAVTLPNAAITLPVLANDHVSPTNSAAILRVTQPAHGQVVINSTPAQHAELTPLFQFAANQLSNTVRQVGKTNLYPWYLTNGVWYCEGTNTPSCPDCNWIGGFFPGSLWLVYEYTGDTNFSKWAQEWQAALAPEQYSTNADDVSFLINTSFGNGYRITGNPAYKGILTNTCRSFTNRWNRVVGCLADDRVLTPPPFEVIIDTMVNTEIFYRPD
jgi:hypothetical protein